MVSRCNVDRIGQMILDIILLVLFVILLGVVLQCCNLLSCYEKLLLDICNRLEMLEAGK